MDTRVYIMAGGAGTRLKPLSQTGEGKLPKQFLSLTGGPTLLQETLLRLPGSCEVSVIPERSYCNEVRRQAAEVGLRPPDILDEPYGCNTAAAVISAAAWSSYALRTPGQVIGLIPADHMMDRGAFRRLFDIAVKTAGESRSIVTIGITPDKAETGYGYIRVEGDRDQRPYMDVHSFVEKPDKETAEKYLASGSYFWNSGMFFGKAEVFIELALVHCAEIAEPIIEAMKRGDENLDHAYGVIRAGGVGRSIDFALMEKIPERILLVPAPRELGWNDLGSWEAVSSYIESDGDDNCWLEENPPDINGSRGAMICNYTKIPVVVQGAEQMILIITEDGILLRQRKG